MRRPEGCAALKATGGGTNPALINMATARQPWRMNHWIRHGRKSSTLVNRLQTRGGGIGIGQSPAAKVVRPKGRPSPKPHGGAVRG